MIYTGGAGEDSDESEENDEVASSCTRTEEGAEFNSSSLSLVSWMRRVEEGRRGLRREEEPRENESLAEDEVVEVVEERDG